MKFTDNAKILYDLIFLMRSQWWSAEKIKNYQEKRMIRIMRHAASEVPFYKSLGIHPESIQSGKDIERFPVMTKQVVQNHQEDLIRLAAHKENLYVSRTSGTTCEPTLTYFDRDCWLFNKYALKIRRILTVTHPIFKKYLMISEQDREGLDKSLDWEVGGHGFLFMQKHLSLFDDMDQHLALLSEYKPDILCAFPSYLSELIDSMKATGMTIPEIPAIFTSSELLTPRTRRKIETNFQAKLFDTYGSTEFKEIASQCKDGRYHINFESVYVESERGGNGDGEKGSRLLVSSMNNYAMPLLRFDMGDRGEIDMGRCGCGRSSPYLEGLYGREVDFLMLPSGKRVSPYILTMSIEKHTEIRKYQIVQLSLSEIRIDVVFYNKSCSNRPLQFIEKELRDLLKEELKFHFRRLDHIPVSKSGKFHIVSREFPIQMKTAEV